MSFLPDRLVDEAVAFCEDNEPVFLPGDELVGERFVKIQRAAVDLENLHALDFEVVEQLGEVLEVDHAQGVLGITRRWRTRRACGAR